MSSRPIDAYRSDLPPARVRQALSRHTRSVAALAYLHALPAFLHLRQLTEFVQARRAYAPDEPPLGGWLLMRRPADPSVRTVSPNADTLYGAAYLLLDQQGPMVVTLPPMPDRYHSVAVMDAYFTTVDIIGTTSEAGGGGSYLVAPPGWTRTAPPGIRRVVVTTTPSVCLFQRIYLRGPDDLEAVHALQDAVTLTPLAQWVGGMPDDRPLDLAPYEIEGLRSVSDPLQLFELTAMYTETNLPDDPELVTLFRAAAVGPGSTLPQDPALREAVVEGAADARATIDGLVSAAASPGATRDGWTVPDPAAGTGRADLAHRAATQIVQMGLLPANEAVYLTAYTDIDGQRLDGAGMYELRFGPGALPPHADLGFWSLTMYDETALLVPNEIDRYLVRPDTPGLTADADGGVALRLQHRRPGDDVPAGNWLPAPAGAFSVALRVYLPDRAVLDGRWQPPPVRRVG